MEDFICRYCGYAFDPGDDAQLFFEGYVDKPDICDECADLYDSAEEDHAGLDGEFDFN